MNVTKRIVPYAALILVITLPQAVGGGIIWWTGGSWWWACLSVPIAAIISVAIITAFFASLDYR